MKSTYDSVSAKFDAGTWYLRLDESCEMADDYVFPCCLECAASLAQLRVDKHSLGSSVWRFARRKRRKMGSTYIWVPPDGLEGLVIKVT